jgi:signal peptidase I
MGAPSAGRVAAAKADELERTARLHVNSRKVIRLLVQAVMFLTLLSLLFFRVPQVEGRSMQPGIESGNHVLISTIAYRIELGQFAIGTEPISRGDIVAFERGQGDEERIYLKRVIALPGESVSISNGVAEVAQRPLPKTYELIPDRSNMPALIVPAGAVFVLGDNRAESEDSRSFGPVTQTSIIGKALFVIWPPGHVKRIP